MKTLVIHEMRKQFFNAPLENYILTFDDALYSQYYYWTLIKKIKAPKIFFVATNLIGHGEKREQFSEEHKEFPSCYESLASYRDTGNKENYMRLSELKEMVNEGAILGAHGHNHTKFFDGNLFAQTNKARADIEDMVNWFSRNFKFVPNEFAFPHYEEHWFLKIMLKDYGFKKFHGGERIEIEKEEDILPFL